MLIWLFQYFSQVKNSPFLSCIFAHNLQKKWKTLSIIMTISVQRYLKKSSYFHVLQGFIYFSHWSVCQCPFSLHSYEVMLQQGQGVSECKSRRPSCLCFLFFFWGELPPSSNGTRWIRTSFTANSYTWRREGTHTLNTHMQAYLSTHSLHAYTQIWGNYTQLCRMLCGSGIGPTV